MDRRSGERGGAPTPRAGIRRHRPDYRIVLYMGLLMMLGLIIMYAIGPQRAQVLNSSYGTDFYTATYFFGKQAFSLLFAAVAFKPGFVVPVPRALLITVKPSRR